MHNTVHQFLTVRSYESEWFASMLVLHIGNLADMQGWELNPGPGQEQGTEGTVSVFAKRATVSEAWVQSGQYSNLCTGMGISNWLIISTLKTLIISTLRPPPSTSR